MYTEVHFFKICFESGMSFVRVASERSCGDAVLLLERGTRRNSFHKRLKAIFKVLYRPNGVVFRPSEETDQLRLGNKLDIIADFECFSVDVGGCRAGQIAVESGAYLRIGQIQAVLEVFLGHGAV